MKADQYSRIDSIKVKARADYKCQQCSSDEAVQAHAPEGDHTDWRKGIALCGNCHADKHPGVPRSLFLNRNQQPYWHNISARALAIECHCHARTIIRRAKRLGITSNCNLSDRDKERVKSSINKTQVYKELKTVRCPECKSKHIIKAGFSVTQKGRKQRLKCCSCGRVFCGYKMANKGSTKVKCLVCGWEGLQGDCRFGHDDFYCPRCGKEALEIIEPVAQVGWPGLK